MGFTGEQTAEFVDLPERFTDAGVPNRIRERNPDALIDYYLDNGQHDQYPAAWALPTADVQRAIEHFLTHANPAPWLKWCNNSKDAVIGPAD